LTRKQHLKSLNLGESDGVLAEQSLSSVDVSLVSNDTCFLVRVEKSAETMIVSAISQDVERNSALTRIVGLLSIFLLEK
jgi:hypothetical protein